MTWANFYLLCFIVGFLLSLIAFFTGTHLHLHAPLAHAAGGHGAGGGMSPINFGTLTAFLAWFGGAGYLLKQYYGVWSWIALGLAMVSGIAGAAIVFWFLVKVLLASEHNLDPADYEMVGVLGRVTNPIRASGTGEIVFSQGGTRRTSGARSDDGRAIQKGAEVMVTRYAKGIAYVRPWEDAEDGRSLDSN